LLANTSTNTSDILSPKKSRGDRTQKPSPTTYKPVSYRA
jgi:hypothetical protein